MSEQSPGAPGQPPAGHGAAPAGGTAPDAEHRPQFDILRIYTKDTSLETPSSPQIFQHEWQPDLKVEFDVLPVRLDEGRDEYEVNLRVTVTCTCGSETAFITEVNQAGIFLVRNMPPETAEYLFGATIPTILFPYAREHISSLVTRSTFPPLNLAPVNFDMMFRAKKAQVARQQQDPPPAA